nr:hypothetical protein [uncultured Desulfobulbus sp.]
MKKQSITRALQVTLLLVGMNHTVRAEDSILDFMPAILAAAHTQADTASTSIVGSWYNGDTSDINQLVTIIFFADGTYVIAETGDESEEGDGVDGMEMGTYTWNASTGVLTATPVIDNNNDWGLSDIDGTVTIEPNGDTLTLVSGNEGTLTLYPVPQEEGSIIGSWYFGDPSDLDNLGILTFFANGIYVHAETGDESEEGDGVDGMEIGTYTWNASTGVLMATPFIDNNNDWGLSTINGTVTLTPNGDTLTIVAGDEGATTISRVPNEE